MSNGRLHNKSSITHHFTEGDVSAPDEFLQIGTPENVVFDYEVAGIGSRFLAGLIDMFLIALVDILVMIVAIIVFQIAARTLPALEDAIWWVVAIVTLVIFVVMGVYYMVFEILWNGQSPGKRLVNLRVIRADGTPITLTESLIRNFMRLIDFFPVGFGLAFITMFIDKQSRRLGDLAAGTLVVFDRPEATLESLRPRQPLASPLPPTGSPSPEDAVSAPAIPVERLTDRDAAMTEAYLLRRRDLTDRAKLAGQIAESLHKRMELPYTPMEIRELERWLSDVLKAYHARQR
jgi:uncharacterized RDD family membrane protein YckC